APGGRQDRTVDARLRKHLWRGSMFDAPLDTPDHQDRDFVHVLGQIVGRDCQRRRPGLPGRIEPHLLDVEAPSLAVKVCDGLLLLALRYDYEVPALRIA